MPKEQTKDPMKALLTEAMIERGVGSGWIERHLEMPEPEPGAPSRGDWAVVHGALDALKAVAEKQGKFL